MAQKQPSEDAVKRVVTEITHAEDLEEAFCGFVVRSKQSEEGKKQCAQDIFKRFWTSVAADSQESTLNLFVNQAYSQINGNRMQLLFGTLAGMVEQSLIPAKMVCDALLSNEKLNIKNAEGWKQAFTLMRKIIGGVDYKGCRDVLKLILEKAYTIPFLEDIATMQSVDYIVDVVGYIIDRNACLLPGYFAVYEITKLCGDKTPHWKLGDLLSKYVQSFRPAAQLLTIQGRRQLLPIVGHSTTTSLVWKLSHSTLQFDLGLPLPYDKELYEPQTALLRYVLEQPYSRDMVCNMLSLNKQNKQHCVMLEQQLVEMVMDAMEKSEGEEDADEASIMMLWQHLSSQLIFFVLFQFANFPHMVTTLYEKLKGRNLNKGRDHLMWALLQFISGSIQRNPLNEFLPVMKLYDLLYQEKEIMRPPDMTKATAAHQMAPTCIWIHLVKKAQDKLVKLQRPIPHILSGHVDYLKHCLQTSPVPMSDYRVALLCNAYSTNPDFFTPPLNILMDHLSGMHMGKTVMLPGNLTAAASTQPLSLEFLDSLTVHSKMRLIHSMVARILKKTNMTLAPAMVQTYSRLLVYTEIESLGIKGFIIQLLPSVIKSSAWGLLHTLLEMLSYRLHHIQPHYCLQLLGHLHPLATLQMTDQNQLHLCIENTALRLIMGLGSAEVQPQFNRVFTEKNQSQFLSNDSEELNKVLVLTLARALHVTGSESYSSSWVKEMLVKVMNQTPHSWSSHTLSCFPAPIRDFYEMHPIQREEKMELKISVETKHRKWKSMLSESDLVTQFSATGTPPLFLCVLWRSLLEDSRISPTAYKVLEKIGPRRLSAHLRTFSEYLVYEFSTSVDGQHVNKCVDALNELIWRWNVVSIDRLVLCLALRNSEGNEREVCFFMVNLLLTRSQDFRNRVHEFVQENCPEHWKQDNWHEKHLAFHTKFPEKLYYEGLQDLSSASQKQYLPIYFDNVCLRFLPVFDIVIHRFIELPRFHNYLETLLDIYGGLYKFHDRPLSYLFNTLFYYEKNLRDRHTLKKKLVGAVIGSLKDVHPADWCLTKDYLRYQTRTPMDPAWNPDSTYYVQLVGRLVNIMCGKVPSTIFSIDWRFNEFPNAAAHTLHATCIELMALPISSQVVGGALLDVIMKGYPQIPREKIIHWMNAIGLILTALPETYWFVLNERLVDAVKKVPPSMNPSLFQSLNFTHCHQVIGEVSFTYTLALAHAIWQHASLGQLSGMSQYLRDRLKPVVRTEEQYLFVCHLIGPFLQRLHVERTRCLLEVTVELYHMLQLVDKACPHLNHMDTISDFLYHIKYIFVGNAVRNEVEKVICQLRPALQMRLRFISHHFKEESGTAQQAVQQQQQQQQQQQAAST